MGQPTQRFKKSVSGSIGAGMKSVIGGDGRRFFVLEHKVSSKYHRAGEEQKIFKTFSASRSACRDIGGNSDDLRWFYGYKHRYKNCGGGHYRCDSQFNSRSFGA